MADEPLLAMRGIDKRFPGVHALDHVDFDVRAGEVHALMGENGAGKSTLIKVLNGVYRAEAGTITLAGRAIEPASPADAQKRGISTVFQEVHLVPALSVAENLLLGRLPRRWYGVDWRALRETARRVLSEFDLRIDVGQAAGSFPVAVQQIVAIARAIHLQARLLVLDEPTASLDRHETQRLLAIMQRLAGRGLGVVFVTHFLEQVYQVSDRITVLRNGRKVGTFATAELPRLQLVAHMLGRSVEQAAGVEGERGRETARAEREIMSVSGLRRRGAIEPFDLTLHRGEVLGLAGLLGSGRTETARLLAGADRADGGTIQINGGTARFRAPRDAIAEGVGLCPEERRLDGLIRGMSVLENIALVVQRSLSRFGVVSHVQQERIAEALIRRLGITLSDVRQPVWQLSGGNQQKVILARWLACKLRVLILDEPTRGIDIGAKAQIERLTDELAGEGLAIVFISSELEEVVRRSHRVRVLRDRKHVKELAGDQIEMNAVMQAIAGDAPDGG